MTFYDFDTLWKPFYLAKRGTLKRRFTIREADGETAVQFAGGDVFRFKLWRTNDAAPALDLDSLGPLAGGSTINVVSLGDGAATDAEVEVVFGREDLDDLTVGEYQGELAYVDSADNNHYKPIARGPVYLRVSPTGDFGLT